jgi:hypothetical protein
MRPDTDPAALHGPAEAAEASEGADYARALLARVAAGLGDPRELVALVQFLHSGPMLHGGCAVIFDALRGLAAQGGLR